MEYYHGVCRCCLAKGSFKRLEREYQWLGDREIYIVMMQECFGLSVAGGDESERLICEVCITRLRDASNFKKQVIVSEKYFQMSVDDSSNQELMEFPKPMLSPGNVKKEELDDDYNSAADDTAFEYDVPVKVEDAKPEPCEKEPVRITVRVNSKKRQTRKKTKKNEASTSNTSVQPDKIGKLNKITWLKKRSVTTPSEIAIDSIACVLTNCTAMPFRFHQNKFKCFFCDIGTLESAALREHTLAEHSGANMHVFIKHNMLRHSGSHVKVDIADLSCRICHKTASDLDDIIKHLTADHKLSYDNSNAKFIPFKLSSDFACLTCGEKFDFFGSLLKHMNQHVASWPCEVCGASFTSRTGVRQHALNMHKAGGYMCNICDHVSGTRSAKRHHDATHNVKSFKCNQCDEKFATPYKRRKHLASAHNLKLEHECPHCDKSFIVKSVLLNHVKHFHLKEKNHFCEICGDRFSKKYNLQLHMVRHKDEKTFSCHYCRKKFARKKNLEVHVRIHTNDKRCVCKLCGKAFVQTASLKLHLRVHHPGQQ